MQPSEIEVHLNLGVLTGDPYIRTMDHPRIIVPNQMEEFITMQRVSSFHASCDFCHLLLTFTNCLDPDQDRQNVGPDLDPNRLTL